MKCSVVMTHYNRAKLLDRSLPSVIKQLDKDDEIVIVDDGSDNLDVVDVVKKHRANFANIKLFRRKKEGYNNCAIPKNIALRHASNELIIVSEPEVMHYSDCIKQFKEIHNKHDKVFVVAGKMFFVGKDFQPRIESGEVNLINYIKTELGIPIRDGNGWFDERRNIWYMENQLAPFIGSFKRKHLMELNGWDERFDKFWGHDDTDLMTRLRIFSVETLSDNNIVGIHQYHDRPPQSAVAGVDTVNLKFVQEHNDNNEYKANIDNPKWGLHNVEEF